MGVEGNKKKNQDGDLEGAAKHDTEPNYKKCITISTEASLKKMVAPGILVLASPLVAGFIFGPPAVSGLLAGIITSGIQVAISASNTGGAWDNAKKQTEKERQDLRKEVEKAGHNFKKLTADGADIPSL